MGRSIIVDILTDTDLSPGKNYLLVAKSEADGGITGLAGSPDNQQAVVAFTPATVPERSFDVADMIPRKNWKEDESGDLARFVAVLQDQLTILLHTVDRWPDILDPIICPPRFLDLMLAGLGNPFTSFVLSTTEKRRLVGLLLPNQQKGTALGVAGAIRLFMGWQSTILVYNGQGCSLGVTSHLGDPVEPGGDFVLGGRGTEYDFDIRCGTPGARLLTTDEEAKVRMLVDYMKPAHTKLWGVTGVLPPPLPPEQVTAHQHGSGVIRVAWPVVAGNAGYRIFYRSGPYVTPLNSASHDVAQGATYWDDTVGTGNVRYYAVEALGTGGVQGVWSNEVGATA